MVNRLIFSRYKLFNSNGSQTTVPFIKLSQKSTDKKIVWKSNTMRMDKLSNDYYGIPTCGFLIMLANAQYGSMEFDIPDNTIITIPYPLKATLNEYNDIINNYSKNN